MKTHLKILKFLPTCLLVGFLLLILIDAFLPKNFLEKAKAKATYWPQMAKTHLEFSQALFMAGYKDLAEKEYQLAQKSLRINTPKNLFPETENIIKQPEKIKKQINDLEVVLEEKPWYRDVFLNLALLYDQQYEKEKSKEYFQKAFYLDPLNKEVQEIGRVLGFY